MCCIGVVCIHMGVALTRTTSKGGVMSAIRGRWTLSRGLAVAVLWAATLSPASALVTERNQLIGNSLGGATSIEYATAELLEISAFAILARNNDLMDPATVDVIVDGSSTGLQIVIPPMANGVFSAQGFVSVPAGSTFGIEWVVPNRVAGGGRSTTVQLTLHTQPVTSAPVSSSSAVGLGLLALLLAVFSVQRLRGPS